MASIILSSVGTSVGGALLGPVGAFIGGKLGQAAGGVLDSKLLGTGRKSVEGPRLEDLAVQTSTYGRMIPIIFGMMRVGGNIIWSRPISETATTTSGSTGGKGGGGKVTQSATTYSYSVSMAIAICEGEIDEVLRIWADAKQLDLSLGTYRVYRGTETQSADTFIESFEGVGKTPAYRGIAYVVVEDFPLAEFGNRIPNFTFEIKKKILQPDYDGEPVEEMIRSIIMIPGAGEFVYDTTVQEKIPGEQVGAEWAQVGTRRAINMHTPSGEANALLSLDQLADTLPNVEWVGVVACWFGDSLDAATCIITPGVEYQSGATTAPETWTSAGYTRATARQITLIGDTPRYGGTPDDESLLRYLEELADRGYNILFYPMFFMDVTDKPWRGRLTGSAADVSSFFTKSEGYNAFITHYADLVKDHVDAFVIGSELVGLTKVTDTPGNYPAVNQLVSLAATVKGIVGGDVLVSYAADWSEYHHTDGGWYNLDPLWASANIDFIGIDAYFPLTDAPQDGYDIQDVIDGWTSGEGYDFYYTDPGRTTQASLAPAYAWKNIQWFWENTHVNPDATPTAWTPESKPIWFTEYGFPSVDGATNQPNVFYDPTSSESYFPYHSKGRVDLLAQRAGLAGTEAKWAGSDMIERRFVWTWDARPYPYWPDLTGVWADGPVWKTGHWVQGKLGLSSLGAIVQLICQRAGLSSGKIDTSQLTELVDGFIVATPQPARSSIEQLMAAYFFDAVESDGVLKFIPRGGESIVTISEDELLPREEGEARDMLTIVRAQELEMPVKVAVSYINRTASYQTGTQFSQRLVSSSREILALNLPIVLPDQLAKQVGDVTLFNNWVSRTRYSFDLPVKYAALEPCDVITVSVSGVSHVMRIIAMQYGAPGIVRVQAVAEDVSSYDFYNAAGNSTSVMVENSAAGETQFTLLDLPAFPTDEADRAVVRYAASGVQSGWRGAILYRSEDSGANFNRIVDFTTASVMGVASTALASGVTHVFDLTSTLTVLLLGEGELASASELAVLNGANAAMVGDEIIQFQTATLIAPGKYTLSTLLRGRLGTEWAVNSHVAGEKFVLLDARVMKDTIPTQLIGLPRSYKPVSIGATLGSTPSQDFTYTGRALKPYAPVQVTGSRDGGGNLAINWIRRTRIGGDWKDYSDIPLNEQSELYEVEIMNGMTVVRTLSPITSPTTAYSAAQQITDFGSPQASVTVNVYQISAVAGRGYGVQAVV